MPMEKGKADGSCPFVTDDGYLIVARFGPEGKPDHAWKSRIFNNLGVPSGRTGLLCPNPRHLPVLWARPG
jgi:hypothetical protein